MGGYQGRCPAAWAGVQKPCTSAQGTEGREGTRGGRGDDPHRTERFARSPTDRLRDVDAFKPKDVREALAPLHTLCVEHDVTVLGIMHFRKDQSVELLHRVTSSSAFTEGARSVLMLGPKPDGQDGELVLVHEKINVGPKQRSLDLTVKPTVVTGDDGEALHTSYIEIGAENDLKGVDVFGTRARGRPDPERQKAIEFLRSRMAETDGPLDVVTTRRQWHAMGGSEPTLRRARDDMGLMARLDPKTDRWSGRPSTRRTWACLPDLARGVTPT